MARTVSVILDAKVDAYKRGLKDAEAATKKLADAAQDSGDSVEESGKKARKAAAEWEKLQNSAVQQSQAWDGVTRDLAVGGAALAAAAGLAVREFANFDQAMASVAATGADAKLNIDALREAAKQAGADTAFSAVEAAQGMDELARAGVSAKDMLSGGLTGALDLAAAGQLGVAEAAEIASIAMTQFKLSGQDVPHLADLLAAGAGKAMGSVSDMGQALKQGGLVASQFGLDIEETVGTLSAFAAAGLLGSDAGTSFKSMLLKLASPSNEAAREMERLGIAAYDAQGNFVGIENLAGQLKDRMGELDPATRQAALATIFGTDAIRAASILYEQGAEGIANWTAAVDESGYAAQQAGDLQNNLLGDLEKLGGSMSTLGIEAGEAANGPLRLFVQALTTMVDGLAAVPGAAGGLMLTVAGLGGLALTAAGIMKAVSAIAAFKTNLAELVGHNPGLGKAATGMTKLGKAVGIAGLAFTALQLAVVGLGSLQTTAVDIDKVEAAVTRLNNATSGLESFDSLFRDAKDSTRELVPGVTDLSSAFEALNERSQASGMQGFNRMMEDWLGEMTGVSSEGQKLAEVMGKLDTVLAGLPMDQATESFAKLRAEAEASGMSAEDLVALFPDLAAKTQALAAANGIAELSGKDLADAMSGTYAPLVDVQAALGATTAEAAAAEGAFDAAAHEAAQMAEAVKAQHEAMMDSLSAYQQMEDAIQGVNDANREAAGLFMSAQAASDRYIATLQELTDQIKENGTSLDENSEKGRANREYLRQLASQARDVTDAMLDNGDSVDVVNAKMASQRDELIKVLGQFGITGKAAEDYADDLGLIPNYVETLIAVPGGKLSEDQAKALNTALKDLPDSVRSQIITVAQRDGYNEAKRMLDYMDGRTVNAYIRVVKTGDGNLSAFTGKTATTAKASGGYVRGPGTTTSDSIPALLSDKEYVLRAAAVEAIGVGRLDYMNRHGRLPGFADGGYVGSYTPSVVAPMTRTATAGPTLPVTARLAREDIDLLARTVVSMAQGVSHRTVDSALMALGRGV